MMGKKWGTRPQKRDPEDGQQQSLQVALPPFATRWRRAPAVEPPPNVRPTQSSSPQGGEHSLRVRRRTVARMLRVELEATLVLLSQALEQVRRPSPLP